MEPLSVLPVRFHFNGDFMRNSRELHYIGGSEAMAFIDRDKISFPEILGHLRDHFSVSGSVVLHWLLPGAELGDGLQALWDDKSCLKMPECIVEGGVADIYVELRENEPVEVEMGKMSEPIEEKPVVTESREEAAAQIKKLKGKAIATSHAVVSKVKEPENENQVAEGENENKKDDGDDGSSSDSDYMPGDDCDSEEDDEAAEILKKFKDFKKKLRRGEAARLDDVVLGPSTAMPAGFDGIEDDGNETEYFDTDDEESCDDIGSDGKIRRKPSGYPKFKKTKNVPKFCLGMKFSCKADFKKAIIKYAMAERKVINFKKNDPKRVRAKCDWPTCPWVCLLSDNSRNEGWQIVTFQDLHTCPPRRDTKHVTARRIAERYEKFIMANPSWNLIAMQQTIQEEMFANVSISKLKRAKAFVMQKVLDSSKGQYQKLYDYQLELLRSNPGSTVIIHKAPDVKPPTFQRMYICLDALKKGFLAGCRKVIGLDGCFFKGACNGELLCAVGRDANNQMYPIAWAVVEVENNSSWNWFCDLLFRDLGVGGGDGWVFISDQQKGLLDAVSNWAPEAEHRNCARHIYANWRKHFTNKEWQKKFWKCAKASCMMLFNRARAKLAEETREGAQAILNTHPQYWSRAWFRLGSNCDSVDNNICESFNKWIVEARFFPIITMLETIRRKVMVRIHDQRLKSSRWQTVMCPNILKKLNTYINESGKCHAICNGDAQYEVKQNEHCFTVDLVKKECSCRYWQLSGLPCSHAISCIFFKTNSLLHYIAPCYSIESFNKTYSHCLQPVEGMTSWPISDRVPLKAPGFFRMPGRPKKERRREPTEKAKPGKVSRVGTVIRCRRCKQIGHNKATCERNNGTGQQSISINKVLKSTATAIVRTEHGASATLNVVASLPFSQSSSTVTIRNSGTASAHVASSSSPSRKIVTRRPTTNKAATGGMMFLPPWDSAKL